MNIDELLDTDFDDIKFEEAKPNKNKDLDFIDENEELKKQIKELKKQLKENKKIEKIEKKEEVKKLKEDNFINFRGKKIKFNNNKELANKLKIDEDSIKDLQQYKYIINKNTGIFDRIDLTEKPIILKDFGIKSIQNKLMGG